MMGALLGLTVLLLAAAASPTAAQFPADSVVRGILETRVAEGRSTGIVIGLIGLGWWGGELTDAAEKGGVGRVVRAYARNESGREEFTAKHGVPAASSLEAMLDDPNVEGVLIATSHQSHRALVEQAAAAGKHIFVEKPLTTTVAEGRACVEAARQAGVLLQVGHQRRRTAYVGAGVGPSARRRRRRARGWRCS